MSTNLRYELRCRECQTRWGNQPISFCQKSSAGFALLVENPISIRGLASFICSSLSRTSVCPYRKTTSDSIGCAGHRGRALK